MKNKFAFLYALCASSARFVVMVLFRIYLLFTSKSFKVLLSIAFINSIIFVFAFPPYNISALIIISFFVFSYIFTRIKNLKEVLIISFVSSLGVNLAGLYWIYYAIGYVFNNFLIQSLFFLGFIILYGLYFFVVALLFYLVPKKMNIYKKFFFYFIAWATFESLKYNYFGGFPWFSFALIWDNSYIIQNASLFGSFGLSIITIILLLGFWLSFQKEVENNNKVVVPVFIMIIISIALMYLYGYLKVISFEKKNDNKTISVKMIQPNIAQEYKMSSYYANEILNKINTLWLQDSKKADYIILPEVAIPLILEAEPEIFNSLKNQIPISSYLLMGVLRYEDNKYYNSFYAIDGRDKEIKDYYDKKHLVPFGEYIPFSKYIPFINSLVGMSNLVAGNEQKIIQLKEDSFLITICFEGLLYQPYSRYKEADWILNISNEAWFKESIEQKQYLSILRLRSIEYGKTNVKVANTGASIIINPIGQVVGEIPSFISLSKTYNIKVSSFKTTILVDYTKIFVFYTQMLYIICVILCIYRTRGRL